MVVNLSRLPLRLVRGLCKKWEAKIEIKLSANKQDKHRCPFCHADVLPSEETTECFRCTATFHEECWGEHGGCTNCPPLLVNVSAPRSAPDLEDHWIGRDQGDDESRWTLAGRNLKLVSQQQKADAAAYARSDAFLPALTAFALTFALTLFVRPQNDPMGFLATVGLDILIALIVYGSRYAKSRQRRMRSHRLSNLQRQRRGRIRQSPPGGWEFGESD